MSPNTQGALLALLAFALYATHDAVVKLLGADYSPFQLIFFSTLFSFPFAIGMMMRDPRPGTLRPVHPWWIALRSVASLCTALSAFYAFSVLPLAQVYAIAFAQPLLITLLAIPLLRERIRLRRGLAVVVGLLGVTVVLRPGASELSLGHLAALMAAVCGAVSSVIVRKVGQEERPVVLLVYPMLANLLLAGLFLPAVYRPMEAEHMGLLAFMSALGWTGGVVIIAAYRRGRRWSWRPCSTSRSCSPPSSATPSSARPSTPGPPWARASSSPRASTSSCARTARGPPATSPS
jgi:drug/metabolite transporter (DMT)-like permease